MDAAWVSRRRTRSSRLPSARKGTNSSPSAGQTITAVGRTKLAFHDGTTGVRKSVLDVGFDVTYPDWSPDGQSIAVTRIYQANSHNIWFLRRWHLDHPA